MSDGIACGASGVEHETLGSRVDRAMCGDEYLSSRLRSRVSVDLGNSGLARLHHNYLSGQAMYNETAGGSALASSIFR